MQGRRARGRRSSKANNMRIVCVGGGTGLSRLLLGLKDHTDKLTAIVTVGDDGGSSGRLRQEFNVLPPGDVRNCIAALAEAMLVADVIAPRGFLFEVRIAERLVIVFR